MRIFFWALMTFLSVLAATLDIVGHHYVWAGVMIVCAAINAGWFGYELGRRYP